MAHTVRADIFRQIYKIKKCIIVFLLPVNSANIKPKLPLCKFYICKAAIYVRKSEFYHISMMFNIFSVALMAASVWSASSPWVWIIRPWWFQDMDVSTKASVLPPGGIETL